MDNTWLSPSDVVCQFRNDKETDGQLLGLLQETGEKIGLIADILSDIIPETINLLGHITAPVPFLFLNCQIVIPSMHNFKCNLQTVLLVSFLAVYQYKTQLVGILYNYPLKGRWIVVVDIYWDAKCQGTVYIFSTMNHPWGGFVLV